MGDDVPPRPAASATDVDAGVGADGGGGAPPPTCCGWGGHTAAEVGTSWLLPPWALLAWRAGVAAWAVGTLAWLAATDRLDLLFFTNVNYVVLSAAVVWLAVATAVAVLGVGRRPPPAVAAAAAATAAAATANVDAGAAVADDAAGGKRPHRHVLWTVTVLGVQVVATNALFLDVVYWALLYDSFTFSGLVVHALNAAAVLADVALSAYHLRWAYLVPAAAAALLWVFGFAWPYYAASGSWVYGFLDFRDHSAGYMVAIYLGMTAWHFVAGALVVGLCRLRDWAAYRRRRRRGGEVLATA